MQAKKLPTHTQGFQDLSSKEVDLSSITIRQFSPSPCKPQETQNCLGTTTAVTSVPSESRRTRSRQLNPAHPNWRADILLASQETLFRRGANSRGFSCVCLLAKWHFVFVWVPDTQLLHATTARRVLGATKRTAQKNLSATHHTVKYRRKFLSWP